MDFSGVSLDLTTPQIMGVLNVTPDSFSDGGQYSLINAAVEQADAMIIAGANIIDVGGESTRPGAAPVSLNEELDRVIPVIQRVSSNSDVVISIDTSKADVMRQAVEAGATLINDVYALRRPGSIEMAAKLGVPICLMHMQKTPEVMQQRPSYNDILAEVDTFFYERIRACELEGISKEKLILDPGFGFGKTLDHNLMLLSNLSFFKHFSCPILVGLSRKSMLGLISGKEVDQRLYASLSAAVIAALNGASILRVHDVAETLDAISIVQAVQGCKAD